MLYPILKRKKFPPNQWYLSVKRTGDIYQKIVILISMFLICVMELKNILRNYYLILHQNDQSTYLGRMNGSLIRKFVLSDEVIPSLGAFSKLRKATISCVMSDPPSVRPSVRPHG
jgi:hypothetical protein